MPTHNLHGRRPTVAVAAAALAALLSVWVAPVASGVRRADPAPAPTDPPVTDTLPPTTEAPTTTLPSEPSTTAPHATSTTTAARPGASTTTTTSCLLYTSPSPRD